MSISDGESEIWPIFASVFAVTLIIGMIVCYCTCKSSNRKTSNGRWFFLNSRNSVHTTESPVYIVPVAGLDVEGVMPIRPPPYDDVIRNCDNYAINDAPPPYNSLDINPN